MQDAQTFAEVFRGIVCYVSLTLLAILLSATAIAWLAKTVAVPLRRLFGGGIVRAALAVAMVGTGIVESFSKHTICSVELLGITEYLRQTRSSIYSQSSCPPFSSKMYPSI